jgi:hypothetical protein
MSTPSDRSDAQRRLLALAARAEPPPQSPTDARRMVRQALMAAAGRRKADSERAAFRFALAALAGAALVVAYMRLAPQAAEPRRVEVAPPRAAAPLRMQLPSRDQLVATPGAQFELASADPGERRVALRDGAIAFDVAKLASGQRFVVTTPHLRVSVRGTVFSVAVGAQRTEVRVYEGAVAVGRAGAEGTLRAGESYASDGSSVRQDETAPLQREAAAMAARRMRGAVEPGAVAPQPVDPATARAGSADAADGAEAVARIADEPQVALDGAAEATSDRDAVESLLQARAWLHAGQVERALTAARRVTANATTARDEWLGQWLLVQADALRSLDRMHEAALTYREAGQLLPAEQRAQAGFKSAETFLRADGDARGALAALDELGVDAPGSALRERGLLLRIDALQRLGAPTAEVAARYLAEYPDSAGAQRLRAPAEPHR